MSSRAARHQLKPNKLALGLAAGTSAALCTAAFTGYDLGPVEVGGAIAVAGAIGVISLHSSRPERPQPYVSKPVHSAAAGPRIMAPKAHTYVAHPAHKTDAA